jgi:PAS domain S-box-containing protein
MELDPQQFALRLVSAMPDAIVYADAEGVIRFWNSGATRIFGFAEAEAIGQSLDIIIPERLRATLGGVCHDDAHRAVALQRRPDALRARDPKGRHANLGRVHDRTVYR